jgi:hypothetical protein
MKFLSRFKLICILSIFVFLQLKCKDVKEISSKAIIQDTCLSKTDSFNELKLNGFNLSSLKESEFIKNHPDYDSIINNYYFYGKSNILFDEKGVVSFSILDSNLYLNNDLNINTKVDSLIKKFPCSYKFKSKDVFGDINCESIQLYDLNANEIRIYVGGNKVLCIYYAIDETED